MVNARTSLLIVAVLAFLLLGSIQASAYPYSISYHITNTTSSPITTGGISLKTSETCNTKLEQYITSTGSGYSITTSLFSPDGINIGTGTLTNQDNITCKFLGDGVSSSSIGGKYEGKSTVVVGGTNVYTTLSNTYTCDTSGYWINQTITPWVDNDTNGNVPNRYRIFANSGHFNYLSLATSINECLSPVNGSQSFLDSSDSSSGMGSADQSHFLIYPFNSSGGIVNYFIGGQSKPTNEYIMRGKRDWQGGCTPSGIPHVILNVYLVNLEDGTSNNLYSLDQTLTTNNIYYNVGQNLSGGLNLDKNTMYAFVIDEFFDDSTYLSIGNCFRYWEFREPKVILDIFTYTANYECSSWTSCMSGTRTRTCYDLDGIAPPSIEYDSCSTVIEENLTLGFEDYDTVGDVVRCNPTWLFGCGYAANFVSADRPKNWVVVENPSLKQYFLEMTAEWATEGSRSLKMWFIPPKEGEPTSNTTCGNSTTGSVPQIYLGINDSYFLSYNVTFPATMMEVGFDVKRCNQQQRQHYGLTGLFGIELCPEQCYSVNCSTQPLSRYYFNVIDTVTGLSLLGNPFFASATDDTTTPNFDLSDLGIVVNRTYNIVLAVYPENMQDTRGDCVMFDRVYYNTLSVSTIDVIGTCASQCLGYDWIEATAQTNGKCRTIKYENDARCLPKTIAESRESRENYCDGETTLWHYDDFTAKYISTGCEYKCLNGGCMTEKEYTEATKQDSTLSVQTGTAMVTAVSNLFSTPAFLAIVLASLLAALVIRYTNAWQFGVLTFLGILGVLSFLPVLPDGGTLFPAWFWIVLVVLSGAIYAALFRDKTTGGGGG